MTARASGASNPDAANPDDLARLAKSLRDLIVAGDHLRRASAARDGIGLSEFMALSQLYFDGPSGPSELARDLGLTPGSMTLLLDRLQQLGYVDRLPHPSDRRRQIVTITAAGGRLHKAAFGRFAEAVTATVAGLPAGRPAELAEFVDAVVAAVQQRSAAIAAT